MHTSWLREGLYKFSIYNGSLISMHLASEVGSKNFHFIIITDLLALCLTEILYQFFIYNALLIHMLPISEVDCKSFQLTMITDLHAPRFKRRLYNFFIYNILLIDIHPASEVLYKKFQFMMITHLQPVLKAWRINCQFTMTIVFNAPLFSIGIYYNSAL